MRIIAGRFKGRKLEIPAEISIRPTKDRVREAIFSALASRIDFDSVVVCDLYAGSGALGFEALSRGARGAVFCEADRRLCSCMEGTRSAWEISVPVNIICGQVRLSLGRVEAALVALGEWQRVLFIDPPYAESPGAALLPELISAEILVAGSIVVMESAAKSVSAMVDVDPQTLALSLLEQRSKKYGETLVTFYFF